MVDYHASTNQGSTSLIAPDRDGCLLLNTADEFNTANDR